MSEAVAARQWTPLGLFSAFGFLVISALLYAGSNMERVAQLERADQRFAEQMADLIDSRYEKISRIEASLAALDRTDAARTEELKAMHALLAQLQNSIDGSSRSADTSTQLLLDRLANMQAQLDRLNDNSDDRQPYRFGH